MSHPYNDLNLFYIVIRVSFARHSSGAGLHIYINLYVFFFRATKTRDIHAHKLIYRIMRSFWFLLRSSISFRMTSATISRSKGFKAYEDSWESKDPLRCGMIPYMYVYRPFYGASRRSEKLTRDHRRIIVFVIVVAIIVAIIINVWPSRWYNCGKLFPCGAGDLPKRNMLEGAITMDGVLEAWWSTRGFPKDQFRRF